MANPSASQNQNRFGLHYFPDTLHYSVQDLSDWLPRMIQLGLGWVVLTSDDKRAIPEHFIAGLLQNNIQPIIHIKCKLPDSPTAEELQPILSSYARWGVRYVVLFDQPNDVESWSAAGWSHQDLVERFVDRFLPLALEVQKQGLTPIFPPLMPGGSYWDTSFFKSSLQSLKRRGQTSLLEDMAYGAYAYTFGHELTWGEGGGDEWPEAKPYLTPTDSHDQRGFNNYQWLSAIANNLGIQKISIFLFGAGIKQPGVVYAPELHAEIVQTILAQTEYTGPNSGIEILSCNFWLLTAAQDSAEMEQAWIKPSGDVLPIVNVLVRSSAPVKSNPSTPSDSPPRESNSQVDPHSAKPGGEVDDEAHPINHYLLLPVYEWGIADWHLEVCRPYILKYHPTIGFSPDEAALASHVTIIAAEGDFSEETISRLRQQGCVVDHITGDGTSIASKLLER